MKKRNLSWLSWPRLLFFGLLFFSLAAIALAELGTQSHNPNAFWWENDVLLGATYELYEFASAQPEILITSSGRDSINVTLINYTGINVLTVDDIISPPLEYIIEVSEINVSINSLDPRPQFNITALSVSGNTDFTWRVRTTDVRGDVRYSTLTLRVLNDSAAPTYSTISESPAPATYAPGQAYTFNITWSDDVSLNQVILEFNGVNYTSLSENGNTYGRIFTDLSAGSYSYRWYATDHPSNQNDTGELIYTISPASDEVSLTINSHLNQDVNITYGTESTATATSTSGTHQLFRNGILIEGSSDTSTLAGGTYNYTANSTGNQNYTSNAGQTHTLTVERAASAVNLLLDGNDEDINIEETTLIEITGELITGSSELEYYDNEILISSGQRQFNTSGTYNITLIHPLNQNYTAAQESHYIVVKPAQAPTIEFAAPTPADNVNLAQDFIEINVTAGDDYLETITIELYDSSGSLIRSQAGSTSPLSFNFTNLNDGTYTFNATATDTVGHANSTASRTVTLDTTPPLYSNRTESPAHPATFSSGGQDFFFNITWSDNLGLAQVTLEFNGVTYTNLSRNDNIFGGHFINLSAGSYPYHWYADDIVGNQNDTGELTYTINSPPSSSDGGGGGGGGDRNRGPTSCAEGYEEVDGECLPAECRPSWECGSWSSCAGGQQTRSCSDANACGSGENMPDTSRACSDRGHGGGEESELGTEAVAPSEPLPEEAAGAGTGGNVLTGAFAGATEFVAGNKGKSSFLGLLAILAGLGVWKRRALKSAASYLLWWWRARRRKKRIWKPGEFE